MANISFLYIFHQNHLFRAENLLTFINYKDIHNNSEVILKVLALKQECVFFKFFSLGPQIFTTHSDNILPKYCVLTKVKSS